MALLPTHHPLLTCGNSRNFHIRLLILRRNVRRLDCARPLLSWWLRGLAVVVIDWLER